MMKKIVSIIVILSLLVVSLAACDASDNDRYNTQKAANVLAEHQPTPTDIDYSLERYNLVRRAYWVNGQREKAAAVVCPLSDIPLGYIVLITEGGTIVGKFVVEGKVTSLNSYLTPSMTSASGIEVPDIDGSYGENDNGIFFFTPSGQYIEWSGIYLYSDIPFVLSTEPLVKE